MKIAFVVPGLDPMGPIILVKNLVIGLQKFGHDITVFYLFDRPRCLDMPCRTCRIQDTASIFFDEFDIIHTHCFSADRYVDKRRNEIKRAITVTTIHQDTYESFKYNYPTLIAYLLTRFWLSIQNHSNGVIAISKQIKDIHQRFLSRPIQVVYNGIDVQFLPDGAKERQAVIASIKSIKSKSRLLLGTFANVVKRKGLDQILKVLLLEPNWHFAIIGDGPYKNELVKMSSNIGVSDRVHFYQYVDGPFLCIEDFDVYCMPSYSEGFGLALLEAASMGKAVVCSNLPSFHEIFHNDEAEFFDLNDITSLHAAIHRAIKHRKTLEEKSKQRASYFSKERMALEHLKFYNNLLEFNRKDGR